MEKFNVTNPDDLPGLYQFQYQQLNRHVNFLNEQVKELEKTIYPLVVLNEDVQRILWIPGIGKISAFKGKKLTRVKVCSWLRSTSPGTQLDP